MARLQIAGFDLVDKSMRKLADKVDRNGEKAVKAGADVAVQALKNAAPVRTGGLQASLKADAPKHGDGIYSDIYPRGTDSHGERYATIGFVLEYGRSNMAARPWMRPTADAIAPQVQQAIRNALMED